MKKDINRYYKVKKRLQEQHIIWNKIEGVDPYSSEYKDEYLSLKNRYNINNINYNNFDWKSYLNNYPDLKNANIITKIDTWLHWNDFGKKENRSPFNNKLICNPGTWGCLKSHINVIKDAIKNNYNKILVLEDDVVFHNNFANNLEKYSSILEKDWKLFYFGGSQHEWDNININQYYYHPLYTRGTFAYGINSSIYNELLILFTQMNKPVDIYLFEIQNKYKNKCYVLYPNLIISDVTESNTQKSLNMNTWSETVKWNLDDYLL